MPLAPGTRLGPYEVVAPLGAGGMGEVYRARDSRLHREVAIKVLPESTAADPETLARFEREARVLASLADPHLLALFDVGTEGGATYAVTELLEGSTLRDRLAGGPLPVPLAADFARQILKGLAAAHGRGIIHRDLKPENVFVTGDAHVKILDFGLARRTAPDSGTHETSAQTITSYTRAGAVVGTASYMSPEQLRGDAVDARSDLFSFGAVLYELLSGRRAFPGGSWADISAAILMREPDPIAAAGVAVPPALEAVARRCLAKNPGDRFATAREVIGALDAAITAPMSASGAADAVATTRRGGTRGRWLAIAAAAALVVVAAVIAIRAPRGSKTATPSAPIRTHAIAMLEFENLTGDPSRQWISRGLPELLGTALARSGSLDVYDPQRLTNLLAGPGARDTTASMFQQLRARGVGRAVVGSILRAGSGLRVQCRVLDVESGRVLHADDTQSEQVDDLIALAAGLIPKLQTWLEIDLAAAQNADAWLREITTSSSDAYKLYLREHEALLASRWREAASFGEQAVALDSDFVAARVDLTGALWNIGDPARLQLSLAAADRLRPRATPREALQIDQIKAVIQRDPEGLIRASAALAELYPENRFFRYLQGRGYFTAGHWARCVEVLDPLAQERWTWSWTYVLRARALEKLGRVEDAKQSYALGAEVTKDDPELLADYAQFLKNHGENAKSRELLTRALRSPKLSETPDGETDIRLQLGAFFEAEGARDSARRQYERVLAVLPPGSEREKEVREALARVAARN